MTSQRSHKARDLTGARVTSQTNVTGRNCYVKGHAGIRSSWGQTENNIARFGPWPSPAAMTMAQKNELKKIGLSCFSSQLKQMFSY